MANLTLRNVDEDLIERAKTLTGKGTASQALIAAADQAHTELEYRKNLQDQLSVAQQELQRYKHLFSNLDGLCRQVREITGQRDMVESNPIED